MPAIRALSLTIWVCLLVYTSCYAQVNVSGSVSGIWTKANSPYILNGSVSVPNGQTLTIQAGVEVQSTTYSDRLAVYGTLLAQGTVSDSIRFQGFSSTAVSGSSHGGEVYFDASSVNSVLDYVRFDQLGDAQYYGNAVQTRSSSLTISRSTIQNSENVGIYIASTGINPVITATRFINNPKAISSSPSSVGGISNLTNAAIRLRSEATSSSCIIPKPGPASFYELEGGTVTISASTTTTIQPGVEVRFLSFSDRITVSGTLLAQGTGADSIRFQGFSNTAVSGSSHGGEVYFDASSVNSVLDYVRFDQLGDAQYYGNALQTRTSSLTIVHSTIQNSENVGIYITLTGISPVITTTRFINNAKAISASPSSVGGISSLTATAINLRSEPTSVSCIIPKPGPSSYYQLEGGVVTVSASTTTTIQAGAELRFPTYLDRLDISGTLLAQGTAADSVYFRGYSSTMASGSSHGGEIYFTGSSINSVLDYVVVDQMGDKDSYPHAIRAYTSSLTIAHSMIRNSENMGVYIVPVGISPVITASRFTNNFISISAPPSGVGGISSLTNVAINLRQEGTGVSCVIPKPGPGSFYQMQPGTITISASTTTTIQPGVEFRSANYTDQIMVYGTLMAQGTVSDSIRFQGISNTAVSGSSHSGQIYFSGGSANSVLDYVAMDQWGDRDSYGTAIGIGNSVTAMITNSSIRHCESTAITAYGSSMSVINSLIHTNGGTGISIMTAGTNPTISEVRFSGNSQDILTYLSSIGGVSSLTNVAIGLRSENVINTSVVPKPGPGSYYQFQPGATITITANTTAIIQPGVELRSTSYTDHLTVSGTLLAQGTAADSIRFRGFSNTTVSGSTHGGEIYVDGSSTNSILDYVSIDQMGDTQAYSNAIQVRTSSLTITHTTIRNSENNGINIATAGVNPTITQTRFANNPIDISAPPSGVGGISSLTNVAIGLRAENTNVSCVIPKPGPGSFYQMQPGTLIITAGTSTTIQPGVEFRSANYGDRIMVNGTLLAQGTSADSIRFRGFANPAVNGSSHGGQLYFASGSANSQLSYVAMDQWGDRDTYGAAIGIGNSVTAMITNSSIRNSEVTGVSTYASSVSLINSRIHTTGGTGLDLLSAGLNPMISGIRFSGNSQDILTYLSSVGGISSLTNVSIGLRAETVNNSMVVPKPGPGSYYQFQPGTNISIAANTTAIIQSGVELRSAFYADRLLVYGTLIARGTVADTIRFRGFSTTAVSGSSHGGQIYFASGSANSVLDYVSVDQMGDTQTYGAAIETFTSSLTVTRSTIRNSESIGVHITGSGITPTVTATRFFGGTTAIRTYPSSCGGVLNNTNARIALRDENLSINTTLPFPGQNSYYVLEGQLYVQPTYTLTIEAGSLVDFGNSDLYVAGALRAIGTETAPIQFLRLQTPTTSTPGGRVYLHSTSNGSELNYVTFDQMGSTAYALPALHIATPTFSVANISIANSQNIGLQLTNVGGAVIASSNFYSNKTGIYVNGGNPTFNRCNIYANADYGINNVGSAVADTVDARNSYWGTPSGPYHSTLNPTGTGDNVSNKVKFLPFKQQPQNGQISDIGISAILAPLTDCNHTATDSVRVRISNYGNVSQSNFTVSYRLNNSPVVSETVTSAALLPGRSLDYTFTNRIDLSATGTYTLTVLTNLPLDSLHTNDTLRSTFQHLPGIAAPGNLLPIDNSNNVDVALTLSWGAVAGAVGYELYVWKSTDPVPTQPLVANLTQIAYTLSSGQLQYGTSYKWKVAAKRTSCRASSAVLNFTVRQLPDLIVDAINVPTTATSETDMVINWRIKNQGTGNTQSQGWNDLVYLSDQPTLFSGTDNFYVISQPNFSALNAGQSYQTNNVTFRIPQGVQGQYYVIVQTNSSGSLPEVTGTNNTTSSTPISIALAPPPDLQVTDLVVNPLNAFSEDSITVTYTVRNAGTGPTTSANWNDQIILGQDQANPANGQVLYTFNRTQVLLVNGTYTVTRKVKLPERISGTYFIHVITDRFSQVYEYTRDDNNTRTGLAMSIIQRPTPNLTVSSLAVSSTLLANNQSVTLQWTTNNDGAITAQPMWGETVYLSTSATFGAGTTYPINSFQRTDPLASLASSTIQHAVTLPATTAEGNYYLFVRTDSGNSIYENPDEADNVSPASPMIQVQNPDLRPLALSVPATATSEQTITLQWTVKNDGLASIYNASWSDQLYLSTNNTFEPGTDIQLTNVSSNQLLAAGGEYSRQATATLPVGISGNYYVLLVTDNTNGVFEKNETNNLQAAPLAITLAPWADLQVTSIVAPAVDTVGTSLSVRYVAANSGAGAIVNKSWQDYIYLSPTPTINPATLLLLGTTSQNRSLSSGQSYTQTAAFLLPTSLTPGNYYVVVNSDVTNSIFENNAEGNNNRIAASATNITSLPVIDLSTTAGAVLSQTVTAGQSINIQWTVRNNSAYATLVPSWLDAVYLSNNPVLDASDVLLATQPVSGPLAAGATYNRTLTIPIPASAQGTLYILVTADRDNQNNDDQRGNNTLPLTNSSGNSQAIVITVPPPADLVPQSLLGPTQATVSQPINITYTVKNNGTGITPAANWTDHFYLATDTQLTNGIFVGSIAHSGAVAPGSTYTVQDRLFMPPNVSGNYVLVLKSDGNNEVFERNGEDNNTAFANIFINPQQPSDLTVSQVTVPAGEQYAGSPVTIGWTLSNQGANAANGFLREAVYLSKDAQFDASDVLFGTLENSLFLPAQATLTRSLTGLLANVTMGDYYVIVRTDILNNILEQNDDNNLAVSGPKLTVSVRELVLNIPTATELIRDKPLYYKITIPSSLTAETLSVTLKGDSTNNAINRLFLRKDSIPTANRYDFAATIAFKANQEVVVPSLLAGTYYLLALGTDTAKVAQPVTLLARTVPFGISNVDANKGGNTGLVTVKILGAKFEPGMTVSLVGSATHVATSVYYVDPSKLFATFNLAGAPTDTYTVKLQKAGGATTQLPNGFSVVTGTPGGAEGAAQLFVCTIQNIGFDENVQLDLIHPASVRRNQKVKLTVAYANVGNVDIPAQTRMLLSLEGAPISFTPDFTAKLQELMLEFKETDGPPGILRAGTSGYIDFYTHAIAPIALLISQ
ncbi:hypothetical protein IC229_07595 [Spirosoma sp. BT702]|uniref:Fibronectin type-III domain-containing protein n=1 Tax=Spirosoma profusum TaxID=2771354 RepID=A0A926XU92_9BACT|nr:CARDB domain-containing protein [Spirosoma profusum]MBD2700493.1 hypothetical protein [Spirosoma profusum]